MRISDWSSDVCSSDLPVYRAWRGPDGQAAGAAPPAPRRQSYGVPKALPLDEVLVALENVVVALDDFRGLLRAEPLGADLVLLEESEALRVLHRPLISQEIGSAAGRERVCQYV